MPIGLAGRAEGARVSLIQLFPSPNLTPERFALPTGFVAQSRKVDLPLAKTPLRYGCRCLTPDLR